VSDVAILSFSEPFEQGSGCKDKVWIPLNTEIDRAKYSLALMAYFARKTVTIRAFNEPANRLAAECLLYDMIVSSEQQQPAASE
jgi:hypothetical protein